MDVTHWDRLQTLFSDALDRPAEERAAFLETTCDDPVLRKEVYELLASHERGGPLDALEDEWMPAPGALEMPDAPTVEGRHIGPYRVIRRLGHGGMGDVFLAERADGQFERKVAIKLLRDGLQSDAMRTRFLQERQTLARLEHPGIARLIDGGLADLDGGHPYFAMEVVEGDRIDRYCDAHQLDLDARLALFGQVCAAVHHAHTRLVVHRDLKPSNILVTEDGGPHVKLLDFGIAKLIEDVEPGTGTQTRLLTPEYAAPEQITGGEISTATDVYSLGVVLYELLTGRRPVELADLAPGEVVHAVCETDPPAPSTVVSHAVPATGSGAPTSPAEIGRDRGTEPDTLARRLRGDLDTICLKALDRQPERRYASAEAFLEDIKRHLDGLPVRARPASVGYRVRKFVSRHRAGVLASAMAVLALVASLVTMTVLANRAASERDRAQAEAAKAEQTSDFLQAVLSPMNSFQNGVVTGDSTLMISSLVRRAAATVDADLADQPEVRATAHRTLGMAFYNLGLLPEAERHVWTAHSLRDSLFDGVPHPDRIQSLEDISFFLALRSAAGSGEWWSAADSLMRLAVDLTREHYGAGSRELADSYVALINRTPIKLNGPWVTDVLNEAYAIWASDPNGVIEGAHSIRLQIVIDHLQQHRFAAADSAAAALSSDLARYSEPNDLRRADLHHHWSAAFVLSEQWAKADAHIDTSLAILEQWLPPDHPNIVMTRGLYAPGMIARGQFVEAEAVIRDTGVALEQSVPNAWAVYLVQSSLGAALAGQGRDAEAEPLLVDGLTGHRAAVGDRHHWIPYLAQHLVHFYDSRGRSSEADAYRALLIAPAYP